MITTTQEILVPKIANLTQDELAKEIQDILQSVFYTNDMLEEFIKNFHTIEYFKYKVSLTIENLED